MPVYHKGFLNFCSGLTCFSFLRLDFDFPLLVLFWFLPGVKGVILFLLPLSTIAIVCVCKGSFAYYVISREGEGEIEIFFFTL